VQVAALDGGHGYRDEQVRNLQSRRVQVNEIGGLILVWAETSKAGFAELLDKLQSCRVVVRPPILRARSLVIEVDSSSSRKAVFEQGVTRLTTARQQPTKVDLTVNMQTANAEHSCIKPSPRRLNGGSDQRQPSALRGQRRLRIYESEPIVPALLTSSGATSWPATNSCVTGA
jgi:hypothetical protein